MWISKIRSIVITWLALFSVFNIYSQDAEDVRYVFKNTSFLNQLQYDDTEIYIAVIGRSHDVGGGANVFLDNTTTVNPELVVMSSSLNTLIGPDGDGYGDVFSRLSELPVNTDGEYYIDIPPIFGGQIWIGLGSPMYISLGEGTYAGADIGNPTDPNFNVRFEIIEFTQTQDDRIISNTTRVDVYQYPMGQEMYGPNDEYLKVGETVSHEQVIAKWKLFVDEPFLAALDEGKGLIHQPSKIPEFQEGGAYDNYMGDFVDEIWVQYSTETLQANWGGVSYTANVVGDQLVWNTGESFGKPSTSDIIGGTGDLNAGIGQIFGVVINRGVLDLDNHGEQVWDDEDNYYKITPKNDYTHFFHSDLVSFESQTYAFAYDDVFDHSSTSTMDNAKKVVISIGGFGIEHTQVLTEVYIDPLSTEIDEFQTFQFEVKGLDQALIDMDLPDDAEITWTVVEDTSLIDQTGLFGPADVGSYTVEVTVVADGVTYKAESSITVNEQGTSGQVCVGEIDDYTSYRIEPINDRVFLTLVPTDLFDGNGEGLLFYDRASSVDPTLSIDTGKAVELVGVFIGDRVEFSYLYFLDGAPFQRGSGTVVIENLGTCDGLVIEEYVVQIVIDQQNQLLETGDVLDLTVTGITNEGNSEAVDEDIVWSGEGVDENGSFTTTTPGVYVITANVDGYSAQTTITVASSCTATVLDLGTDTTLCNEVSFKLNLPAGTYTDLLWSGTGSSYLGNDLTVASPTFTAAGVGDYTVTVEGLDENSCPISGTRELTVNALPVLSISYSSTELCDYDDALGVTLSHSLGTLTSAPNTSGLLSDGAFNPSVSGSGNYTIAYNYTESSTGCAGKEVTVDVLVNERPITDVSTNETEICDLSEAVTLVSIPSGGVFTGVGVNTNEFDPSGLDITETYEITYEYTDPITGCEAVENTFDIELIHTDEPTVESKTVFDYEVTDQASVPDLCATGVDVNWYSTDDISTGSLSNEDCYAISFVDLAPMDGKIDEGTYTVYANQTIDNCPSESVEVSLMVVNCTVPMPTTAKYNSCEGSSAIEVTATGSGGDLGWWTSLPSNPVLGDEIAVGDKWDGHQLTAVGVHTVYVAEYSQIEGCYGSVASLEIEVYANPVAEIDDVDIICSTESSVGLTYSPSFGVLSGNGITGDNWTPQFDDTNTGVTITTITLTAEEDHGTISEVMSSCSTVVTKELEVVYLDEVTGTGIETNVVHGIADIAILPELKINYAEGLGATFTVKDNMGQEIANETSNPREMYPDLISEVGTYEYTVVQKLQGCESDAVTSSWEITACPVTVLDLGVDTAICDLTSFSINLLTGTYTDLLWSGTGSDYLGSDLTVTSPMFTASEAGSFTVSVEGLDDKSCPIIGSREITVNELPDLSISYGVTELCDYDQSMSVTLSHGLGTVSSFPITTGLGNDGTFDPSLAGTGDYTMTYNYTDVSTGCTGEAATVDVTVNERPITDLSANQTEICDLSEAITLISSPSGGMFRGAGVSANQFDPQSLDASTVYEIVYDYTDPLTGCEALQNAFNIGLIQTDVPVVESKTVFDYDLTDQASVPDLCATGLEVNWYSTDDVSRGSLLNGDCYVIPFVDVAPVDGNMDLGTYTVYVNQTIDNCPSKTVEVSLIVTNCTVPMPTTVKHNSCEGDPAVEVSAIGTGGDLGWWRSLPSNPVLGDEIAIGDSWGSHGFAIVGKRFVYVAEYSEAEGCYGPVASLEIEVHTTPVVEIVAESTICSTEPEVQVRYIPSYGVLSGEGIIGDNWTPQFDKGSTGITTTEITLTATEEHGEVQAEVMSSCTTIKTQELEVVHVTEVRGTGIGAGVVHGVTDISTLPELIIDYSEGLGATFSVKDTLGQEISNEQNNPKAMYPDLISEVGTYEYTVVQELQGCLSNPVTSSWSVVNCSTSAPESQTITIVEGEELPVITSEGNGENHIWTEEDQQTVLSTTDELNLAQFGEDYTGVGVYLFYVSKEELGASSVLCRGGQGQVTFEVVEKEEEGEILIPNGFSPNGDSKNETWVIPYLSSYPEVNVVVYNRWGNKVFESDGYEEAWDGMSANGNSLPSATYYYVISSVDGEIDFSGTVTILR